MPSNPLRIGARVIEDPKAPEGYRIEFIDEKEHTRFVQAIFAAFADKNKALSDENELMEMESG